MKYQYWIHITSLIPNSSSYPLYSLILYFTIFQCTVIYQILHRIPLLCLTIAKWFLAIVPTYSSRVNMVGIVWYNSMWYSIQSHSSSESNSLYVPVIKKNMASTLRYSMLLIISGLSSIAQFFKLANHRLSSDTWGPVSFLRPFVGVKKCEPVLCSLGTRASRSVTVIRAQRDSAPLAIQKKLSR